MWIAEYFRIPQEYVYITSTDIIWQQDDQTKFLASDSANEETRVIMLVGCDKREGDVGRSDTLMLLFLHGKDRSASLLSIPRDTRVQVRNETTKINHAYAYGGIDLSKTTVENFLGIQIDNYAEVNFSTFSALVDALGGIDIEVEKDMKYSAEGINLKAGYQTLNGDQALQYVRFRSDAEADLGRVRRQQHFLQVLADKLFSLSSVWKLPQLVSAISNNVESDLSAQEMLSLANLYKDAASSEIDMAMIPGEARYIGAISYYVPFEDELPALVERMMTPACDLKQADTTADDAAAPENGAATQQ